MSYRQVANALGKSVRTIGNQLTSARRRVGTRNEVDLVRRRRGALSTAADHVFAMTSALARPDTESFEHWRSNQASDPAGAHPHAVAVSLHFLMALRAELAQASAHATTHSIEPDALLQARRCAKQKRDFLADVHGYDIETLILAAMTRHREA